jgi:hypothetical protein
MKKQDVRAAEAANRPMMALAEWLSAVRPTTTVAAGPLRIVRLVGATDGPEAVFLEEAMASGQTSVTEVSPIGVVGRVVVSHEGRLPLLLVDGEQIVGAKQNRIVNASFLIGTRQRVVVPVSCVERGRWQGTTHSFESSDTTVAAAARIAKLRRVHASLAAGRGHDADQQAVWRDIDNYLRKSGTRSPSAAFDDGYRQHRGAIEEALPSLTPEPGQVGFALVHGVALVGLDLFGSPSLYERGWRKVARGFLLEVYEGQTTTTEAAAMRVVEALLQTMGRCTATRTPAPGLGETVHGAASGMAFTGVVHDGVLFHAVATSSPEEKVSP